MARPGFVLTIAVLLGVGAMAAVAGWQLTSIPIDTPVTGTVVPPTVVEGVSWVQPEKLPTTPKREISLLFVGDIMLDRNVARRSAGNLEYPFQKLPENFLSQADLTIGNLEGPLTDTRRAPEKSIDFAFSPKYAGILKAQGVDVVSLANNHTLDQGSLGAQETRDALRAAGVNYFGDQVRDDAISMTTSTVRGETIAFVGFNTTDNPIDLAAASATLAEARTSAAYVIAFTHWGTEYKAYPDASSEETAHWLIDHGVDIVIGGHPHWVQGMRTYKGKPIVYSLGNFIFDQDFSVPTREGMAWRIVISDDKTTLEPVPIRIDVSQPTVVDGEEKTKRLQALSSISQDDLAEQIQQGQVVISR